ncbi:hypothetical protein ACO0K3_03745 [Undibacterium sp. Rencai35W]|uniref:hypothetical protein n=1 Tax=Undibacterium sp. Rencai35W TaxID=3413046 RepID=UPI003BF14B59
MTTIAWDGKTLAADKRCTSDGVISVVTKLYKVKGCLLAAAGDFDRIQEMIHWFRKGCMPSNLPLFQRDNADFVGLIVIRPDKKIYRYDRGPYPHKYESPTIAIGSGGNFALAAMHLGCTAVDAVRVACEFDCYSGNGIDTLSFDD